MKKKNKPEESVKIEIISSATTDSNGFSKKYFIVAIVIIVLLAAAIGLWYMFSNKHSNDTTQNYGETQGIKYDDKPLTKDELNNKISQLKNDNKSVKKSIELANYYLVNSDYANAITEFTAAQQQANSDEKLAILSGLVIAYNRTNQNSLAIQACEQIIALYEKPDKTANDEYMISKYKQNIEYIKQGAQL